MTGNYQTAHVNVTTDISYIGGTTGRWILASMSSSYMDNKMVTGSILSAACVADANCLHQFILKEPDVLVMVVSILCKMFTQGSAISLLKTSRVVSVVAAWP